MEILIMFILLILVIITHGYILECHIDDLHKDLLKELEDFKNMKKNMKETSIEEKARCYDKAIKEASAAYKDEDRHLKATLERIFPELKESENERIRKSLIDMLKNDEKCYLKEIAWLEKQGEQKPVDKVEPKFKVGDWITNGDYTWKIVEVEPLDYILQSQDGNIVDDTISHVDEQFHSFTIEDAKDGDILFLDLMGGKTFIYNGTSPNMEILYSFIISNDGKDVLPYHIGKPNTGIENIEENKNIIHPATKEQRDLLFKKMNEAGYEWDAEKKELKKIEQKSQRMISAEAKEAMYGEPAWSEEDNKWIESLIQTFEDGYLEEFNQVKSYGVIDWLKSLKNKYENKSNI